MKKRRSEKGRRKEEVRPFASPTAKPRRAQSRGAAGRGRCSLRAAAGPPPPRLPRPRWPSPAKFQQPPVERAPGTSTALAGADGADQPGCGARRKGSWGSPTTRGLGRGERERPPRAPSLQVSAQLRIRSSRAGRLPTPRTRASPGARRLPR